MHVLIEFDEYRLCYRNTRNMNTFVIQQRSKRNNLGPGGCWVDRFYPSGMAHALFMMLERVAGTSERTDLENLAAKWTELRDSLLAVTEMPRKAAFSWGFSPANAEQVSEVDS